MADCQNEVWAEGLDQMVPCTPDRLCEAHLDACGLECPKCHEPEALCAIESRPMQPGEVAGVQCAECRFGDARVVRGADGGLYVEAGAPVVA